MYLACVNRRWRVMGKSQYTLCCELWFAGLCLLHGHTLPVKDPRHVLSHIIASISPRKLCLQQSGWNIDNACHRDTCVTKLWENMQSNFWLTKVYWIEHANVFVTGKNISNLSTTMNSELVRLSEWTNVNKLSLNMKKQVYVILHQNPSVLLNDIELNCEIIEKSGAF